MIAGQHFEVERVGLDALVGADGARDRVLVFRIRRRIDLVALDLAAPHQLVDERVILGELVHLVLPQQIDARVAHVRDEAAIAGDEQRRRGRAHAALLGLGLAAVIDRRARRLHRVLHHRQDLLARVGVVLLGVPLDDVGVLAHHARHFVDSDLRRDLARSVSAHTIGDHEQVERGIDEVVVLVVVALPADVCCGEEL